MKYSKIIGILVLGIMLASGFAAGMGIFSQSGPGTWEYESIRGRTVTIYGQGVYKHMSADVAVQGIGQDYVTLFIGIPLLGIAFFMASRGGLKSRLFLSGVLAYFLVTYLFYLTMGTYSILYLVYVFLLGSSFFALSLSLLGFEIEKLPDAFGPHAPIKLAGGFLIFNTLTIALMWLGVVIPPLLDGSIYPAELQHYTTLIVQGLDLGLLLPLSFVSGVLLLKKRPLGYLLVPVYLVFLSLLMTALSAKIVAMGMTGVSIIPAVFIIPTVLLITLICTVLMLKSATPQKV